MALRPATLLGFDLSVLTKFQWRNSHDGAHVYITRSPEGVLVLTPPPTAINSVAHYDAYPLLLLTTRC